MIEKLVLTFLCTCTQIAVQQQHKTHRVTTQNQINNTARKMQQCQVRYYFVFLLLSLISI